MGLDHNSAPTVLLAAILAMVASHDALLCAQEPDVRLEIFSGDGQTGMVGRRLAAPFVVRAVFATHPNVPIEGVRIHFERDVGGICIDEPDQYTNQSGLASFRYVLGIQAGEQTVTASTEEGPHAASVDFHMNAQSPRLEAWSNLRSNEIIPAGGNAWWLRIGVTLAGEPPGERIAVPDLEPSWDVHVDGKPAAPERDYRWVPSSPATGEDGEIRVALVPLLEGTWTVDSCFPEFDPLEKHRWTARVGPTEALAASSIVTGNGGIGAPGFPVTMRIAVGALAASKELQSALARNGRKLVGWTVTLADVCPDDPRCMIRCASVNPAAAVERRVAPGETLDVQIEPRRASPCLVRLNVRPVVDDRKENRLPADLRALRHAEVLIVEAPVVRLVHVDSMSGEFVQDIIPLPDPIDFDVKTAPPYHAHYVEARVPLSFSTDLLEAEIRGLDEAGDQPGEDNETPLHARKVALHAVGATAEHRLYRSGPYYAFTRSPSDYPRTLSGDPNAPAEPIIREVSLPDNTIRVPFCEEARISLGGQRVRVRVRLP